MAYNSSKGPQTHGDVKYEGDAEDTQIDFENDYIALKTNGIQRFIVNSNAITSSVALSCSLAITASHFVGDGSGLTGLSSAAISTYSNAADNRVITSVDASTVQGEANLTFDGDRLTVAGDINMSGMTGSAISGTLSMFDLKNGTLQVGNEEVGTGVTVKIRGASDSDIPLVVKTPSHEAILGVTGSGKVLIGGIYTEAKLNITGSNEDKFLAIKSTDVNPVLEVDNNHLSASVNISASAFFGSGQYLTNLPSAAITTYNSAADNRIITSVNSTTVQGESGLTFDGSVLNVTGDVSGSGVLSIEQIKCSGSVVAASFTGDGSGLTGLSSAAIANYNNASDNRVITSVDSDTVQGEANLTFDGSVLNIAGDVSGSGVLSINQIKCSGSVAAASFVGDGSNLTNLPSAAITTYNTSGDNRIITSVNSTTVQGESALTFDGETLSVTGDLTASVGIVSNGHMSASLGITGSALHVGNFATVIDSNISGSGVLSIEQIKCSGSVSAVSFVGDGSNLTNLPSAAITTYNTSGDNRVITSVNSTTVQGESGLTFDGETFNVTGDLTASAGISSAHIVSTGHISASSGVTGSQLHAGGVSVSDGTITMRTSTGSPSKIELYCEVSNAHKVTLKAPAHAQYAGDVNFVLPPTEGTNGQALITDGNGATSWSSVGGGGGSPGGSDGQVQYNNGGSFGGESNFVYDDSNDRVGIGTSAPSHTLSVTGSAQISSNLTVSGTIRTAGTLYTTYHSFNYGGTSAPYIPFIGNVESTNGDYRMQMIAPFPGRLVRLIARTKNSMNGFCTASVMVAGDTVEDFLAGGSSMEDVSASMDAANTSYNFNFTGSSHYSAGNIIGVKFKFRQNPGDVNMTCIWEHDQTSI